MELPPWTQVLVANLTTYWQVYFDTNRAIRETFAAGGYPAPEQLVVVRNAT